MHEHEVPFPNRRLAVVSNAAGSVVRILALRTRLGAAWDAAFARGDLGESERVLVRIRACSAALAAAVNS